MKILSLTGILFLLLVSVSCADDASTPSSKVEYVLGIEGRQSDAYAELSHKFLINYIFENEWTVAYYVQPECNFSAEQVLAIKDAIEGSLRRWLSPLTIAAIKLHGRPPGHENSTVVDKFDLINITKNYELGDGYKKGQENPEGQSAFRKKNVIIIERLLSVFFYCGTISPSSGSAGGGYYILRKVKRGDGNSFFENTIHIYIPLPDPAKSPSQADGSDPSSWCHIGSTGFNRFILMHEIGHAMGLADTYYEEGYNDKYDQEVRDKYFETYGVHPPEWESTKDDPRRRLMSMHILGNYEPPSLMSGCFDRDKEPYDGNKAPRLLVDDFLGMVRAYVVFVMEKQD